MCGGAMGPFDGHGLSNYLAWLSSNLNICLESWNHGRLSLHNPPIRAK